MEAVVITNLIMLLLKLKCVASPGPGTVVNLILSSQTFKVDTITKVAFCNFWENGVLGRLCCPGSHG